MHYINYINLLLIPGVYGLTFAPVSFPILVSLVAFLIIVSCVFTTLSQLRMSKQLTKKDSAIYQIESKRAELLDQKEALENELATSSQVNAYKNIQEINQTYSGIIEEQSKEIRSMKIDIESLYDTLKNLNVSHSENSFTDNLEGLPHLFKEEDFANKRQRKSSIGIHKKRLGIEKEDDFTQSI